MDKNNTRKIRIPPPLPPGHTAGMDEYICDGLFERAVNLAYRSFVDPTDDHIEAIYHRLVLNHQWGAGDAGAVTMH